MTERTRTVIAKAKNIERQYGKSLTRKDYKNLPEPVLKVKPKGTNPLKGKYGFKATLKF